MRRSSILLLAAIVTVSPLAFANPPSEGGQDKAARQDIKSFTQLDKNQDGQLTKAELPASTMHSQHFAKIDADGNGSLSKTEVDTHLVDMGLTPGDIEKMDHMEGMEHGDEETGDDYN